MELKNSGHFVRPFNTSLKATCFMQVLFGATMIQGKNYSSEFVTSALKDQMTVSLIVKSSFSSHLWFQFFSNLEFCKCRLGMVTGRFQNNGMHYNKSTNAAELNPRKLCSQIKKLLI